MSDHDIYETSQLERESDALQRQQDRAETAESALAESRKRNYELEDSITAVSEELSTTQTALADLAAKNEVWRQEVARLRTALESIAECVPVFYVLGDEWRQIEPDQSEEFETINIPAILETK